MSTVNADLQIAYKDNAFFSANATLVLKDGQLVYNSDTGDLFIGDNSTQLGSLTAINASGLTVGTTAISGATNGYILYNNNGTLGEKNFTGTGDVVLATSPTISALTVSNGLTVSTYATTGTNGYGAYFNATTGATNNYALGTNGNVEFNTGVASFKFYNYYITYSSSLIILASGYNALISSSTGAVYLCTDGSVVNKRTTINPSTVNDHGMIFDGLTTSNLTASTEYNTFRFQSTAKNYLTGALATYRNLYVTSQTINFAGASTITNGYGAYFESLTAGTNATITNNYAAGFAGNVQITGFLDSRIKPRVTTIVSSATPTINTDNCDAVDITALAADITSFTTNLSGTPNNFDTLVIRIKDDGTARALTWGASFEARGTALPTTTVISKVLTVGFIYDTTTSKWGCIGSQQEA